jgi:3-oxoacyl-[acyl-carrier-protein] synthase II
MTSAPVEPLKITGCGVVSPAGYGLDRLGRALRDGQDVCADPAEIPGEEEMPGPIRAVPELRAADHLGRKGTRHLDRTNTLGLVASKMALEAMPATGPDEPADVGVVMGTSTGSVRSSTEFARDTLVEERPYLVNPALFPNTVMNSCAGQIAIWNSLQGVNATFSGGQLSTLQAVRFARNALGQRQADRLLTGGVEELSPQTAWAWRRSGVLPPGSAVGEGCAVFVLERADSATGDAAAADGAAADGDAAVEVLACEMAYCPAPDRRPRLLDGLTRTVERALERSEVEPDEVTTVSLSAAAERSGENRIEERAVHRVLGGSPRTIRVKDTVGECYSASGALQLAAAIADWRAPESRPGVALITSLGRDGNVGCLVIRPGDTR